MASDKFLRKPNQRMGFVEFWANYVKKTPNKVWSKQQADFINSVMQSGNVSPELYMKVKSIVKKT